VPCIIGAEEDGEDVDRSWLVEVAAVAGVEGWFIDSPVIEPGPEDGLFAVVPQPPISRLNRPTKTSEARVFRPGVLMSPVFDPGRAGGNGARHDGVLTDICESATCPLLAGNTDNLIDPASALPALEPTVAVHERPTRTAT
jgi:hypothetical protein